MTSTSSEAQEPEPTYAMRVANGSHRWYEDHAIRSRRNYKVMETLSLIITAAIPTSAVLISDDATVPAILGAVVVILTGVRSIFHWQENYLRFSEAREAVAERRLYGTGADPYHEEATRDQVLVAAVTRIEQKEMRGWIEIASPRPEPVPRPEQPSQPER